MVFFFIFLLFSWRTQAQMPLPVDRAVYQLKTVDLLQHQHSVDTVLNRISFAKFDIRLRHLIHVRDKPWVEWNHWKNSLQGEIELVCGVKHFKLSRQTDGLFQMFPLIFEDSSELKYFLSWLFYQNDKDPNKIQFVLIYDVSFNGRRRVRASSSDLTNCSIHIVDSDLHIKQEIVVEPAKTEGFSATHDRLLPPADLSFLFSDNDSDDNDFVSFVEEQTATKIGIEAEVKQLLAETASVFFQTNNKLLSLMKSGVLSRQAFGAIIDPIINNAPPAIAQAAVQAITKPVMGMVTSVLVDLLMEIWIPSNTIGASDGSFTIQGEGIGIAKLMPGSHRDEIETKPHTKEAVCNALPLHHPPQEIYKRVQDMTMHPVGELEEVEKITPPGASTANTVPTWTVGNACQAKTLGDSGERYNQPPSSITEETKQKLALHIMSALLERIMPEATDQAEGALRSTMWTMSTQVAIRGLVRELTETITQNLTLSLVKQAGRSFSRTLTGEAALELSRFLTPALTHTLGLTITHTMSRTPLADYFCWYCTRQQLYCDHCRAGLAQEYYQTIYTTAYAHYYSVYFAGYYAGLLGNNFVDQYLADQQFFRKCVTS